LLNSLLGTLSSGVAASTSSYESIATVTLGSDSNTITFSSIPSTYTHLQFRILAKDTAGSVGYHLEWRFNSDGGANYPSHALQGDGSSATAAGYTGLTYGTAVNIIATASHNANTYSGVIMDVQDYASTTKNKTVRVFGGYDNNGSGVVGLDSSVWLSTSAITSVVFTSDGPNYKSGTSISLYGIKG
jgi:hypothetical protein